MIRSKYSNKSDAKNCRDYSHLAQNVLLNFSESCFEDSSHFLCRERNLIWHPILIIHGSTCYANRSCFRLRQWFKISLFSFNKKCFQKEINFLILDWLISFDELSSMLNLKTVNSRIMLYLNKAIKVPRAFLRLVCTQLTNQNRSKCSRFS